MYSNILLKLYLNIEEKLLEVFIEMLTVISGGGFWMTRLYVPSCLRLFAAPWAVAS